MSEKLSERMRESLNMDTLTFPVDAWADEVAALEQELERVNNMLDVSVGQTHKLEQRVERLKSLLGRAADYIERSNSTDLEDLVGLPPVKDTVELLRKEALAAEDEQ